MSDDYEFYLRNLPDDDRAYEVITLKPSATESYSYVKDPLGVTVTIDGDQVDCVGVNMLIERATTNDDLDEIFHITFSDADGELQESISEIPIDDDYDPVVEYRVFMASDLTTEGFGPVNLIGGDISFSKGVATIEAKKESLVNNRCGELYTIERFPTLRGLS